MKAGAYNAVHLASILLIQNSTLPYPGDLSPRTLATMERQLDLLLFLRSFCDAVDSPPTWFATLSSSFTLDLPVPLVASTFQVTRTFSNCWSFITCIRNRNSFCLIFFMISVLVSVRYSTSAFLTLLVHGIFSILLKKTQPSLWNHKTKLTNHMTWWTVCRGLWI